MWLGVLSYYTQGQSTYLTLLDMRCYSIQSIGVTTWDVGTHSYAGAYTRSTAKLYIGDLRGRNISTIYIYMPYIRNDMSATMSE